ncbi:MAG TPA: LLM class flavin-dependent oxidoreductase [Solirubrobacteraceae bacterium]|nr:LLM class flavin-dependent oxidoreductase [Solirubrobacteraceae bacterium]
MSTESAQRNPGTPPKLTVRVGVGLNPFAGSGLADGSFWTAVEAMEELGYDSIWLSDTAALGGLAPLPALAAIAMRTERLKLGTSVLVLPPRNPVLVARELATIDALSGGRLLPAGGLGIDVPSEIEAMGVRRDERAARLAESIALIKALWSGEPTTVRGRFWSVTELQLTPTPTRKKLEFWLGGRAPAALRRVGELADGWLSSAVAPDEFPGMVATIRAAAAEANRTIDEDHYGATVFSTPAEEEITPDIARRLALRRGLAREDYLARGTGELRTLLDRFRAGGASKFVVVPVAGDLPAWLGELYREVIAPIEAADVSGVGGA